MHRHVWVVLLIAITAGCARTANVAQEREGLMALDREWSQSTKDPEKFASYFVADAVSYAPNSPAVAGQAKIRDSFKQMISSAPDFSLQWTATKAEVASSGDVGYTTGTYQATAGGMTDKGKYISIWKKQPDGKWKVTEDIYNSDQPAGPPPAQHVLAAPSTLQWGAPPPSLPAGAKLAVVSGDPGKPAPYVVRVQMPAGYKIMPHWHPTDENVTVLSGTFALGMGDNFDAAAAKDLPAGGLGVLPAQMHHYALARSAATVQIHGIGPLALNYVNPADDPSKQAK